MMISAFRTSDFQISGSAISSHKNIHDFEVYINSEFKGTPIIRVHYNEDDIDGEINL